MCEISLPIIFIIFIIIIAKKQGEELKLGVKNSLCLKYNCKGLMDNLASYSQSLSTVI